MLNYRYFGISASVMRRFVGSRMYLLLKAKYAATPDDPVWEGFVEKYAEFVEVFEESIMPVPRGRGFLRRG